MKNFNVYIQGHPLRGNDVINTQIHKSIYDKYSKKYKSISIGNFIIMNILILTLPIINLMGLLIWTIYDMDQDITDVNKVSKIAYKCKQFLKKSI